MGEKKLEITDMESALGSLSQLILILSQFNK